MNSPQYNGTNSPEIGSAKSVSDEDTINKRLRNIICLIISEKAIRKTQSIFLFWG